MKERSEGFLELQPASYREIKWKLLLTGMQGVVYLSLIFDLIFEFTVQRSRSNFEIVLRFRKLADEKKYLWLILEIL